MKLPNEGADEQIYTFVEDLFLHLSKSYCYIYGVISERVENNGVPPRDITEISQ